jgi:hypothetical protein
VRRHLEILDAQRRLRFRQHVARDPDQALLGPGDRHVGEPFPQRLPRLHPARARGGVEVGGEDLHLGPLGALRLVDRHRRAVQEGGAHACGEGDEGFLLPRFLDLDDGRGREARAFGADHVQAGEAVLVAGAEIDHRRALDEAARLQVDAPLAMLQRQFDPVAESGSPGIS